MEYKLKKIAKAFVIIACIANIGILSACSKEKQIEGSWRITSFIANGNGNNDMSGKIWTFNDSGACYLTFADETLSGQWRINGNELSIYGTLGDYHMVNATLNIDELKSNSLSLNGNIYLNSGSNSGVLYVIASFSKI